MPQEGEACGQFGLKKRTSDKDARDLLSREQRGGSLLRVLAFPQKMRAALAGGAPRGAIGFKLYLQRSCRLCGLGDGIRGVGGMFACKAGWRAVNDVFLRFLLLNFIQGEIARPAAVLKKKA